MFNENWGAEEWRQPNEAEGETVLFAEHGRILPGRIDPRPGNGVDCRSHSFKVVRAQFGGIYLLVRHGGGDERLKIDYSGRIISALEALESDARYWLLHSILDVHHHADRDAREETSRKYASAFVEGRLKKRRRNRRVYVEIEPPALTASAA
jgi:hypothetical protein